MIRICPLGASDFERVPATPGSVGYAALEKEREIGRIEFLIRACPRIELLRYESPEIGDGLLKMAAELLRGGGFEQVEMPLFSEADRPVLEGAGFVLLGDCYFARLSDVHGSCGGHPAGV